METPTRHLDLALRLWVEVLRYPRFDPERVESWRLRQLELVRRGEDQPGSVAVRTFNRVLFGDHPIGWNLTPEDLAPGVLTGERLRRLHEAITCADNMTLGVVGDISRADAAAKLEAAFGDMPACAQPLVPPDPPVIRDEAGVFIVHKAVNQTSLVMGQPGGILQRDDPEYYAAQIANWILGGADCPAASPSGSARMRGSRTARAPSGAPGSATSARSARSRRPVPMRRSRLRW